MIKIIEGVIDRRILVNYRMDPEVLAKLLPKPFVPRVVNGYGLGGICLIRFKKMRPAGMPKILGTSSENGTHRFCVQWEEDGRARSGVYVKQRFTSSRLHEFGGDRVFPGRLTHASFNVEEENGNYQVQFKSDEGEFANVNVSETEEFPSTSIFESIDIASSDFERDKIGFSPTKDKDNTFKGVQLNTTNWNVSPLEVTHAESSLFSNPKLFPPGSVELDHALLMKDIEHSWQDVETVCCS